MFRRFISTVRGCPCRRDFNAQSPRHLVGDLKIELCHGSFPRREFFREPRLPMRSAATSHRGAMESPSAALFDGEVDAWRRGAPAAP
jgi:hypothetical protein